MPQIMPVASAHSLRRAGVIRADRVERRCRLDLSPFAAQ